MRPAGRHSVFRAEQAGVRTGRDQKPRRACSGSTSTIVTVPSVRPGSRQRPAGFPGGPGILLIAEQLSRPDLVRPALKTSVVKGPHPVKGVLFPPADTVPFRTRKALHPLSARKVKVP